MLVFLVQDITDSQNVYVDAIGGYLDYVTNNFEIFIIVLSIGLMISVFLIVIYIIHITILNPINQLTEHILGTNKNIKKKQEIEK
jgi:hypothetical protein